MKIGFFTVFRTDPQHFLHATALVAEAQRVMPGVETVQFTDERTDPVPGVSSVRRLAHGPMLQLRLEHYAACEGEWLFADTDVSLRRDVRSVFDDPAFDVALVDRNWPHRPQSEKYLQTMPFNTGVCFSRASAFWQDVVATWLAYPGPERDWLSEQRAVYAVVREGKHRVKVLPGMVYNYPPASETDPATDAAIVHYKGARKPWLTKRAYQVLVSSVREEACA